ncbi:MAG: hypothetical protein NTU80_07445 [Verrucomicrobia bacterium]|nr:hypothetical protein [Verrucomicrobiota bacterium]
MKKTLAASLALLTCSAASAIDRVTFEDFDYTIVGNVNVTGSNLLASFWGTYSNGSFTVLTGSNNGYFDLAGDDAVVNYSATDNLSVADGALLALGIFDISNGSLYSAITGSTKGVILTDSTWVAPAFSTTAGPSLVGFTNTTVAQVGGYSRVGTIETITLVWFFRFSSGQGSCS